MKSKYGRLSVVAVFLAVVCVYWYVSADGKRDKDIPAASGPDATGGNEKQPLTEPVQLLNWWQQRLEAAASAGDYEVAGDYATRKASYYRSIGNEAEAAAWYETSASHWAKAKAVDRRFYDDVPPSAHEVTIEPYVSVPAGADNRKLAKFEPSSGTYLGLFGLFDWPAVEPEFGQYHPIGLTYSGWRKDESDTRNYFPVRFMNSIKSTASGALQIGWEPHYGLDSVKDDDYARSFARQAKEAGIPIFMRYASEMNGAWVPWYDEPAKYIEKFRLMSKVMKEEAPNVAMVWSPNFWPNDNIDDYYPGDEYVDWVGFSLYATPFFGENEDFSKNQIDYFAPLYEKYAHKPIMISEGGVTHYIRKTGKDYAKWGESQLANMYAYLPRMFPQVKAITYFNIAKSRSETLNADYIYDIRENTLMYDLYRRQVQSDYYLTQVEQGAATEDNVKYVPLRSAQAESLTGKRKLFVYVKMPMEVQPFAVAVLQGDRRLAISYEVPWEVELDFSTLQAAEPLTVAVYNSKHEEVARQPFEWSTANLK
ncbi:glycoside hydrolase family 26 protein [Paenibacillus sp. GCM10012303]|uniref:glycoside hydrolase family 26 protein n=1 Tax=Paenibacillus sp. GCM10012303 TaxID=3317340 RepID=UPI0036170815